MTDYALEPIICPIYLLDSTLAHATEATDRAGASELSPGLMPSRLFSEIPLVLRSGSWFGISTRELKARHLHSLIAIFCPRQHHFRPLTLVASSDDSFGIALAGCCSCEVDRCRVTRSFVHRNFGDQELILKRRSGLSYGQEKGSGSAGGGSC